MNIATNLSKERHNNNVHTTPVRRVTRKRRRLLPGRLTVWEATTRRQKRKKRVLGIETYFFPKTRRAEVSLDEDATPPKPLLVHITRRTDVAQTPYGAP